MEEKIYGTAIAFDGFGLLIRGESGSGKTDLAFHFIQEKKASLISDDQVVISRVQNKIFMSPPPALQGLMEVRSLGILNLPWVKNIELRLIVDLVSATTLSREASLDEHLKETPLLGCSNLSIRLASYEMHTPVKLVWLIRQIEDGTKFAPKA